VPFPHPGDRSSLRHEARERHVSASRCLRPVDLIVGGSTIVSMSLLVGDPERERAAGALQRHYREGRLTAEELGQRLQTALSARTGTQLRAAFRGLPPRPLDLVPVEALRTPLRVARNAAILLVTGVLWLFGTFALLIAFVAWLLADGPSVAAVVVCTGMWLALSWLLWAASRRRRAPRH
jgi:Flp pilus assembly protein TadB